MGHGTYYNEIDIFAAEWLRNLIKKGLIPDGEVDTRSIADVVPSDLGGFDQCHFFAGIGGWSYALRLAGWPDDKPVWTGSCPCQPFSVAGKGKGVDDERHLWPEFHRLIAECRPSIVFGEQVASRAGREWFAGVRADLEDVGYGAAAADLCAAGVGAPHIRQRLYWVATDMAHANMREPKQFEGDRARPGEAVGGRSCAQSTGRGELVSGPRGDMADTDSELRDGCGNIGPRGRYEHPDRSRSGDVADAASWDACAERLQRGGVDGLQLADRCDRRFAGDGERIADGDWSNAEWRRGADGKERRVKPGIRLLVDGVSNRVGRLRGYGNAIVPQVAAEFIRAFSYA